MAHSSFRWQDFSLFYFIQYILFRAVFPNENLPSGLNTAMFIPALQGQCTPEQQDKWLHKARNNDILGTYAQTEMGHGRKMK